MKTFQRIYLLMFGLVLLIISPSCEKDVTEDFDLGSKNQLVLRSFISPQDLLVVVKLRRTQPALGRTFAEKELQVSDATVAITDGVRTAQLSYDAKNNLYSVPASEFPILAGKTYTMNVSAQNGSKLSAQTTVPLQSQITINSYILREESKANRGNFTYLTYNWSDAAGVENYYRPLAYRVGPAGSGSSLQPRKEEFYYERTVSAFVSDANLDGQEMVSNELISSSQSSDDFPRPYKLYLNLLVTDKSYYLFHRSLLTQQNGEENPFAEPTLVYTNVQGGLGVFGSYNVIEEVREVK